MFELKVVCLFRKFGALFLFTSVALKSSDLDFKLFVVWFRFTVEGSGVLPL